MRPLVILLLSTLLFACNSSKEDLNNAEKLYKQAISNLDLTTAKLALNQILLLDSNNLIYKDSLARLYIQGGNYEGGVKLAEQLNKAGKADKKLLELTGVAYQQMGKLDESDALFNKLWNESKDFKYLYQIMVIQYEKGNKLAFDSLSSQILANVESDSVMSRTTIDFPGPVTGVAQFVPLKAATLFLIGKNAYDREQDLGKSITYYQKSIEAFDPFEMARYYLTEIARMQQGGR